MRLSTPEPRNRRDLLRIFWGNSREMASYRILIKRSAEKEIRDLPRNDRAKVAERISALRDNPRPEGSQRLSGRDAYRIRVGDYRVIYTINDGVLVVEVVKVGHRREVYR